MDRNIADHFGWPDLEFAWKQDRDIDPLTQAQINQIYLAAGVLTPGEVRAEIGKGDAAAKRQAGGVVAKYSPDQPRDQRGRWSDGSGVAETSDKSLQGAGGGDGKEGVPSTQKEGNSSTQRLDEALAGVNPTNGVKNCSSIAKAVISRLTGKDAAAVSDGDGDGKGMSLAQLQKDLGVTPDYRYGSVASVYKKIQEEGDGAVAVMIIFDPTRIGGHAVVIANDNGHVGALEGQNWRAEGGPGVISNAEDASARYNPSGSAIIGLMVVKKGGSDAAFER